MHSGSEPSLVAPCCLQHSRTKDEFGLCFTGRSLWVPTAPQPMHQRFVGYWELTHMKEVVWHSGMLRSLLLEGTEPSGAAPPPRRACAPHHPATGCGASGASVSRAPSSGSARLQGVFQDTCG